MNLVYCWQTKVEGKGERHSTLSQIILFILSVIHMGTMSNMLIQEKKCYQFMDWQRHSCSLLSCKDAAALSQSSLLTSTSSPASSVGSGGDHHIARWIPESCPWSARWRKTIRLSRQRLFTPRGRDVITHRFLILTGQLSRGRAAISPSATSCRSLGKMVFFRSELIRSLSSAYS